jgi:hypothetical protein
MATGSGTGSPSTDSDLTSTSTVKSYLGITSTDNDTLIGNLVTRISRAIEKYCERTFNSTAYIMERYDPTQTKLIYVKNYPIISLTRLAVGRRPVLEITHSDSGSVSATVSVSSTGISLIMLGGSNAGTNTAAFGTYATLSSLATQITTYTSWSATTVGSEFDNMASTDLIPIGSRETQDAILTIEVPNERLTDFQVDFSEGSIQRSSGFFGAWNDIFVDYTGGYASIPDDLEQIAIEVVGETYQARTKDSNLKSEKIGDYSYTNQETSMSINSAVLNHADDLAQWKRMTYA